jgi:WD40 repeat protein
MRTFEVCKDCLLGLYISEEPQMIITAGSYHHCNFHIVDFKGAHLRPPVQSDISDGISVVTEKHTRRSVYLSESSEIRVFRATTSVKNEFKDFGKEHSMFGHKGKVLGVTFSADGSRAYSLSSDKTLKEWDLKMEGFSNSHIKCLNTWPIEPSLVSEDSQLQWCGHDSSSSDHETQHLCISTGDKLHFLDCTGSDLKMRESIEEAHQGDNISRLTYIYDPRSDKKGILFSKSEKRLYGWKPKFT